MIRQLTSYDNEFDGLAAYETENSILSGLHLYDNRAAGLSFDIRFNNNLLSDIVITGSRKVGVFMRDSRDNVFNGLQIRNSGEHGIFLAQVDFDMATPASGNTFNAVTISGSAEFAVRVNDASCVNNLVTGAQFVGNRAGCLSEQTVGQVRTAGMICR
jgi:hypothetical protein